MPPLLTEVNVPVDIDLGTADRDVSALFTGPDSQTWQVPAFLTGKGRWCVRFAAPAPGRYRWQSDTGNEGTLEAAPYTGTNPLLAHGRLRIGADRHGLEHNDGTPFLWLGDTWWMGLTPRLDWPEGFRRLTADRADKGFSVIQIVAGPLPDFCASTAAFHPQQANEGGLPWQEGWTDINPAYYDMADRRILHLVNAGLSPCIVAMWGYYLPFMGLDNVRRHWRNLVARYSALPVTWCLAGEAAMPTYAMHSDPVKMAAHKQMQIEGWTEAGRYLRSIDPYANPVTIHPAWDCAPQVTDPEVLDFLMLQTGHGGYQVQERSLQVISEALLRKPRMPVLDAEPVYEGIMAGGWQEVQRFQFWTRMTMGMCGHTYGAQGMWAMSSRNEPFAGTTVDWGRGYWQDVMHYAGAYQSGMGRKILLRFPFHELQPLEEPRLPSNRPYAFAAGIPGRLYLYYFPAECFPGLLQGMRSQPLTLTPGAAFSARYIDPCTGTEKDLGTLRAGADGSLVPPAPPSREDWVLVLESMP